MSTSVSEVSRDVLFRTGKRNLVHPVIDLGKLLFSQRRSVHLGFKFNFEINYIFLSIKLAKTMEETSKFSKLTFKTPEVV